MKKAAFAAVIILLALVIVSLGFFRRTPFSYSGVIEAVDIDVPARLNDVITKLNIDEGTPVTAGQVLAELECKQTALQEEIALKEYKRAEQLFKTAAGSKENYENRKNIYDQAALAKTWCKILSPITGRVLHKYYEEGEFIQAGRKLATVADLSTVNAWVFVEHNLIASLTPGQKITGRLPETGGVFEGVILTINDEAEFTPKNVQTRDERARLVFGVKTRFQNDERRTLKPGMTLEVIF